MHVSIGGFQKSSLIDYPGQIAAIVFTQGCNFKCPYCHNPELLDKNNTTKYSPFAILEFLKSRKGKIDGVVITGGEPTLQKNLPEFIRKIKAMGFLVKLDTNGSVPDILENLLKEKLLDYVAMDIKAPIEKYSEVVCAKVNVENITKSIEVLRKYEIEHEFRTTVVKSQLSFDDFTKIGEMIKGGGKYYLQKFIPTKILDENFMNATTYSDKEFDLICQILEKYVEKIEIR